MLVTHGSHPGVAAPSAWTVGNFDGVHRGHRAMLARVATRARELGVEAGVLAVSLVGVTGFWAGLMEIAKKAGVIDGLVKRMGPVMRFLFPEVPEDHPAMRAAGMNMICNVFGLGAAATPPGLAAMERFEELEEERRKMRNPAAVPEGTANREMCTFLILNISSLQLIPVNIIAYRSQYGSVHPTAIVGPALAATAASTIAAVVFCKVMERMGR